MTGVINMTPLESSSSIFSDNLNLAGTLGVSGYFVRSTGGFSQGIGLQLEPTLWLTAQGDAALAWNQKWADFNAGPTQTTDVILCEDNSRQCRLHRYPFVPAFGVSLFGGVESAFGQNLTNANVGSNFLLGSTSFYLFSGFGISQELAALEDWQKPLGYVSFGSRFHVFYLSLDVYPEQEKSAPFHEFKMGMKWDF